MIRVILASLLFLLFNNRTAIATRKEKDTHPACQLVVVVCPGENK